MSVKQDAIAEFIAHCEKESRHWQAEEDCCAEEITNVWQAAASKLRSLATVPDEVQPATRISAEAIAEMRRIITGSPKVTGAAMLWRMEQWAQPAPAVDVEPSLEVMDVPSSPSLDRIEVFWRNYQPGKGSVTLTCYGTAWTAYFGGMSDRTIQQFFADADTGYLVTKLGITPELKQRKRDHEYLARIISAVKNAMCAESEADRG